MKIGAFTGCHQMHERSFNIKGYQFPVCARCTGLFTGQLLGIFSFLLFSFNLLLILSILSTALLAIDGIGQLYEKWISTNLRRFLTGLSCGFFVTGLFLYLIIFIVT